MQGMAKNVFFLTHKHKENGGEDDSVSKFNTYEVRLRHIGTWVKLKKSCRQVDMIVDLVMYLLR